MNMWNICLIYCVYLIYFFEIDYDIFWKNYNSYEIFFFVLEFDEVKFVFLFIFIRCRYLKYSLVVCSRIIVFLGLSLEYFFRICNVLLYWK